MNEPERSRSLCDVRKGKIGNDGYFFSLWSGAVESWFSWTSCWPGCGREATECWSSPRWWGCWTSWQSTWLSNTTLFRWETSAWKTAGSPWKCGKKWRELQQWESLGSPEAGGWDYGWHLLEGTGMEQSCDPISAKLLCQAPALGCVMWKSLRTVSTEPGCNGSCGVTRCAACLLLSIPQPLWHSWGSAVIFNWWLFLTIKHCRQQRGADNSRADSTWVQQCLRAPLPSLFDHCCWFLQRLDGSIKGEIRKQALDHFNADGSEVPRSWAEGSWLSHRLWLTQGISSVQFFSQDPSCF